MVLRIRRTFLTWCNMKKTFVFLCLLGALGAAAVLGGCQAGSDIKGTGQETAVSSPLAEKLAATIEMLPELGGAIEKIDLVNGIRAIDGEIATSGEVKILVNLNWQVLKNKATHRQALDYASARIVAAVFSQQAEVTKLRVIVKTLNEKGTYQAAAKVFSFTRAMWELTNNNPRYDVRTDEGAAELLRLGDYVIWTENGWMRGH